MIYVRVFTGVAPQFGDSMNEGLIKQLVILHDLSRSEAEAGPDPILTGCPFSTCGLRNTAPMSSEL